MKKCIVFDVDRTMVDSYMPELLSLQEAILNVTGRKIDENEMNKLTAFTTSNFFKYLSFSDDEILKINREWENTFTKYKTKCFPKIKEIIKELYNSGYTIGIITSRTMNEFHELDDELNDILNYFKIIITSDIIKNPKPDRESIDYLCKELEITSKDIIYIGDSEVDKTFAKNSMMSFIPACWENKELENEENACNTPGDIMKLIKEGENNEL